MSTSTYKIDVIYQKKTYYVIRGLILNLKIHLSILAVGGSEQLHALYKNGDIRI
jgi:hypothetical protein